MPSKTLSVDELVKQIKVKNLPSLLLIYGQEDYFCENSVRLIRKAYISEGSEQMDYVKLDFESKGFDLDKVIDNSQLPPWLSTKRVVLVRNSGIFSVADPKKDLATSFEKFASSIPDTTIVVFWEDAIDKRKKGILKTFETKGIVCESPFLNDVSIASKISGLLGRYELKITNDAVDSLISRSDKSMRLILNEISKILLYCQANKISLIDMEVIDMLCAPDVKGSIFDLTDSISTGNAGIALSIVDNLITLKEPVAKIKFMLAKHIRQLICAKELKSSDLITRELGIHPYSAQKLAQQAPKFTMDKLLSLYAQCAKSDFDFKQGKMDERHSLEILLVLACKSLT
ncbi:MAG: DNA polymerase III subunit delta [Clostridia bacterium]|nr:DNA polymerase III subunit delta [Clostridia bacterium]